MKVTVCDLEKFIQALIRSLTDRYNVSTAVATPDSILLAVLNAVHDARIAIGYPAPDKKED